MFIMNVRLKWNGEGYCCPVNVAFSWTYVSQDITNRQSKNNDSNVQTSDKKGNWKQQITNI